jgi:hypothetical protein
MRRGLKDASDRAAGRVAMPVPRNARHGECLRRLGKPVPAPMPVAPAG